MTCSAINWGVSEDTALDNEVLSVLAGNLGDKFVPDNEVFCVVWGRWADNSAVLVKIAWELINNPLLTEQRPDLIATRCHTNPHPPFTSCWNGRVFDMTSQIRYNQFTCKSRACKKRVRTYCVCSPGEWLCSLHWCAHLLEAAAIWFVGNWYQSL